MLSSKNAEFNFGTSGLRTPDFFICNSIRVDVHIHKRAKRILASKELFK